MLSSLLFLWAMCLIIYATRNNFDHVVFILHTHSDNDSGALFYTSKSDEDGTPLSTDIVGVSFSEGSSASSPTDMCWPVFRRCYWC